MASDRQVPRRGFIITGLIGLPLLARWLVSPLTQPIRQSVICSIYPDGAPWDKPLAYEVAQTNETAAAGSAELRSVAQQGVSSVSGIACAGSDSDSRPGPLEPRIAKSGDTPVAAGAECESMSRRDFATQFVRRPRVSSNQEIGERPIRCQDEPKVPISRAQPAPPSSITQTAPAVQARSTIGRIGIGVTAIAAFTGFIASRHC